MRNGRWTKGEKVDPIQTKILALGEKGKWKQLLQMCMYQKQQFNPIHYATVMSQLVRVRGLPKDDSGFQELIKDLNMKFVNSGLTWMGSPRPVANIVHAIAKMRLENDPLAMQIVRVIDQGTNAEWMMKNGNTQTVANSIWACGKLGIPCPKLIALLESKAQWMFDNGNTQDIANSLWACATLNTPCPNMIRLLEANAERIFEDGNAQAIANVLWACGKLKIPCPNMIGLLEENAEWMFENGKAQNVSNSVWACGRLGIPCPNMIELLEAKAEWMFENGNKRNIDQCISACRKLKLECPKMTKMSEAIA